MVCAQEQPLEIHRLTWLRVGAVWAMDHTLAADGTKRPIMSVRDLASGKQLAWEVVEREDAESTLRILLSAGEKFGLPLVLKSDNGSAFIA